MSDDSRDSNNPFGIDLSDRAAPPSGAAAELFERAGIGFARLSLAWDTAPSVHDALVDWLVGRSIKILAQLGAASDPKKSAAPDANAYARFTSHMVSRYKDRVRHWELWNAPDDERYWPVQDEMKSYAEVLRSGSAAAKAADPSSIIHVGGLGQRLPRSLRRLYALGAGPFIDVVNIQPFVNPLMPDAIGGLRYLYEQTLAVMAGAGEAADTPLWFSRFACPGLAKPGDAAAWFLGKNSTEAQQAEWLRVVGSEALRWKGIEKIVWARWQDTPGSLGDGSDFYGLIRADGTPKPAYDILRSFSTPALLHEHMGLPGTRLTPRAL